jgi:hypothetical protein
MRKYIHIGLPKCASSSLQQFWGQRPDLYFAGKRCFAGKRQRYRSPALRNTIRRAVAGTPELAFDASRCAAVVQQSLEEAKQSGSCCYLLSDEVLSGIGFAYAFSPAPDGGQICSRLLRLFGEDTVIILILREQLALLKSYWRQLVLAHYRLTFHSFIEAQLLALNCHAEKKPVPQWSLLPTLRYDHYLRMLKATGARLMVVPMESLVQDRSVFPDFAGQLGLSGGDMKLPHLNQSQLQLSHNVLYAAEFSDSQSVRLAELFAQSNRAAAQDIGFDLARLGYRT